MQEVPSPNPDEQQPQGPKREEPQEGKEQDSLPPEEKERILKMSPEELANFCCGLQEDELRIFLERALNDDVLMAHISYWQKWLEKDRPRLVDGIVAQKKETYEGKEDNDSLPLHLEKRFTSEELELIFENVGAIQLTFGCSKGCLFCGFDAVPRQKEGMQHIPYSQLANLFQKYGISLGKTEPFLYWASEPSDYAGKEDLEDRTYQDVHQLAVEYAGYSPHVTSRETTNQEWLDFLAAKAANPRVSVYGYSNSIEREKQIIERTDKRVGVVGVGSSHVKGLGASSLSETYTPPKGFEFGIACVNGILLTPRGLYNVVRVPVSKEFSQGQMVVPLEQILDKEIKVGDKVRDLLNSSIVAGPIHDFGLLRELSTFDDASSGQKFRGDIDIRTKSKLYRVWFDGKGIIQEVKELNVPEKKKEDVGTEKLEAHKETDKQRYKERIEQLRERRKRWLEKYSKWQEKNPEGDKPPVEEEEIQTKKEIREAITRAREANRIEVSDKNLSEREISVISSWFRGMEFKEETKIRDFLKQEKQRIWWGSNYFTSSMLKNPSVGGAIMIVARYDSWSQEANLFVFTENVEHRIRRVPKKHR